MTNTFQTWRGFDPERQVPPTLHAEFIPHEFVYPRWRLEVDTPTWRLLQQLVEQQLERDGEEAAEQLLALRDMFEALDD